MSSARRLVLAGALAIAAPLALPGTPAAQEDATEAIARYRELLQDGNPADLWEARGEGLWQEKRGPRGVSLERCDLGKGPGVVKGAYAGLPRYFADADRVMDLETRLVHCMVTQQGFTPAEATRRKFGNGEERSDLEALTAYVVSQSRGMPVRAPLRHPKEKAAYTLGEKMFFYRGGPHDFSCATCHAQSGRRIRLQDLPNLTEAADAKKAYATWPAYRVSQGEVRTMQWRMNDCLRQQRFPELVFGSEGSVALITYLARQADGAGMDAPAIKR
ncbi:MAG TPA: sulfur oxidation c-type cytochrome SoxA [Anaeromyxobacteraceae bacterium]|nr:sulfur oxidation c-type cytochrome SoxA [Anaeromyxobacteraceae bacterium]